MYSKGERFFTNLRGINLKTNVFFNSKKHLQKAFFAKIKIDHRKYPFVIKKSLVRVFFFRLKIRRYGHQKIRLSKPYSKEKPVFQNNEK